ncbi:unnamed protein product [Chrysoparadoxa australica]
MKWLVAALSPLALCDAFTMNAATPVSRQDVIRSLVGGIGLLGVTGAIPAAQATQDVPYMQHAVILVQDMDESLKFWCDGLGMQVVRQRSSGSTTTKFVGYGPEDLNKGGFFSLELVKDTTKTIQNPGTAFQYLGLTLPVSPEAAVKVAEGTGTLKGSALSKGYAEVTGPEGLRVRLTKGVRQDPVTTVGFGTNDLAKSSSYWVKAAGMKEQGAEPFGGDKRLGYTPKGVHVSLVTIPEAPVRGDTFGKVAVLSADTAAWPSRVECEGGKVLFSGAVPGIGTKVTNTLDPEGHGLVFVDTQDFGKEMEVAAAAAKA